MIERQFDDNCDGVQGDGVELDFASRLPGGPLTPALAEAGATTNRSPSPMIGMRGGLDGGPAAAAEPVRGLAAFGSQGSISNSPSAAAPIDNRYYYHQHQHQGGVGPAGSSRLSPRDQAPHHPPSHAGGGGAAAAGGESNGAGRGSIAGENDNTSRERRTRSSAQRSGARSNSPYRGGGGANRGAGASSPGERKRAGWGG